MLAFIADLANESNHGTSAGYSYVNVFNINTDEQASLDSDEVSTYGELEYIYSSQVGSSDQTGDPQHTHAVADTKNKIIFTAAEFRGYAYKYTNTELTFVPPESDGSYFGIGSSNSGHIRHMKVDMEERLLFCGMETKGVKIFHYTEEGEVLNQTEYTHNPSGEQNGIALDTEYKLLFIGKQGNKIQVAKYDSPENPFDMDESFVISEVGSTDGQLLRGNYANGSTTIECDTENKLLFAKGRTTTNTDEILEIWSYDNSGNISYVDTIKGTSAALGGHTPIGYNPFYLGGTSSILFQVSGFCLDETNIKLDTDARIAFVHNGHSICSIPYNKDGTIDADDMSELTYPNNRSIIRDGNLAAENNQGDGLGFWMETVVAGNDLGGQSKRGILIYGSNVGSLNTKVYSRHTNKVWMPKAGLIKPQGTDADDCVAYPIIMNNSLISNRGANHIYYIGSAGTLSLIHI